MVEPFDSIKVALKRGEVDWLNVVPSTNWFALDRVLTRMLKLCRVAHRKGIWWSVQLGSEPQWRCSGVESLLQSEDARHVVSSGGHVCTNAPFWDEPGIGTDGALVGEFIKAFYGQCKDPTAAEVTINSDSVLGRGVPLTQRIVRENENEEAVGRLRNAARAVDRVPGWKAVGLKLSRLIEEVVIQHEDVLSKVLSGLGRKDQIEPVPEQCCELLREKLIHTFGMDQSAVQPGPGGLFPGIVEALTVAASDPDVHVHGWLRGKAPVGITAPIQPGGVFPVISPQSVGKEKDRARYLHAKVWGNANNASYDEHKVQADELFHKEVQKGYVQWAASRNELEREVGTLHLAKIGVIVKGAKMRLIHDLRRNGTNARVTFQERLVLPRLKDLVAGIVDLFQAKGQGEGMDLLTLDFRDACTWSQPSGLSWLEPQWMVSSRIAQSCSEWDQDLWFCAGWLRGSCAALKRGWAITGLRQIVLSMTPSLQFKVLTCRGEDWLWVCSSGGAPWVSNWPTKRALLAQMLCGLGPISWSCEEEH